MTTLDSIVTQLLAAGHPPLPNGHPVADGKPKRYGPGKKYWYSLHEISREDGSVTYSGAFGFWRGTDNNAEKFAWDGPALTPDERALIVRREREAARAEAAARDLKAKNASNRARQQWSNAAKDGESPYLERKKITPESVRFDPDGMLLVPMVRYDTGEMVGLQKITPDGAKRFNTGMQKQSAACRLGEVSDTDRVAVIVEGYATGRSIRMATDESIATFVCLDAGNLSAAAAAIRVKYPDLHLIFCADDDWMIDRRLRAELRERFAYEGEFEINGSAFEVSTPGGVSAVAVVRSAVDANAVEHLELDVLVAGISRTTRFENAGLKYSRQAAYAIGNASVIFPRFAERGDRGLTDFNDLHVTDGLDAVREQISGAVLLALAPPEQREQVPLTITRPGASKSKKNAKLASSAAAGTEPPDHEVENGAYTWQMDLKRTEKGYIISSLGNVSLIFEQDKYWQGVFAWEEFSGRVMKRKAPPFAGGEVGEWNDLDDANAARWIETKYSFAPRKDFIADAAQILAHLNPYHVVREYLESLEWDRVLRVGDAWLTKYMHVEDTEYSRLVGLKWPISAIARVMDPGCKVDSVLILEGPQGTGKSTGLRVLASSDWFTDAGINIGDKDTYVTMRGKWIIELGELDSFSKAESSATKRFFSSSVDTYRPPYGRRAIDVPRQGIFAGTVNFDSYLKDESGNRRYWPVKILQHVELEDLARDRDQIWAEAYHYYKYWAEENRKSGGQRTRPWDVNPEERPYFTVEQEARYEGDVYENLIRPFVNALQSVTLAEILGECLKLEYSKWSPAEQRRVGKAMKSIGWIRKRQSSGSSRSYYYVPDQRPAPAAYAGAAAEASDDAAI